MNRIIAALLLTLFASQAWGQVTNKICVPTGKGNSCQDVTSTNPLPTTATISGGTISLAPFTPTGSTSLSVTASSSRVALPSSGGTALFSNQTSITAYVKFGNSSVVATTADTPIQSGQTIPLATAGATYVAAITANGATALSIVSGTGSPITSYGQVAVNDSVGVDSSGTITGSGQTVTALMDGYDSANVLISGTYGAFSISFQESPDGGTHLAPVNCGVTDGFGTRNVNTYTTIANQTVLFHCNNMNGSDTLVITSTSAPTGTANIDISISGFPSILGGTVGTVLNDYDPPAQSVTIADSGSTSTPGQDSVNQITGTPTAGSVATWAISGQNAVNVQLSGTWAGTEAFEKSTDGGITWVGFGCQVTGAVYRRSTVTGNGSFLCEVGGSTNFRIRQTLRTSGTVVVNPVFTSAGTIAKVANANAVFDNVSGQQVSIKAASTAPVSTDTSAVVALPPSAPLSTSSIASNLIIKGSPGNLYSLQASADSTLSGAAWWLMLYDATTAPGDGAITPLKCFAFQSGTTLVGLAFPTPVSFATGIVAGVSTTGCFTKTASAHAFISGDAK